MLKQAIKKIIPKSILLFYHKMLAIIANIMYWFPSRKMVVIGVTGTKGKSSTVVMITRILEEAGFIAGSTNTIFFKVAGSEWPNTTKQGMLGRLKLQKMLREMVRAKCTHAVIEVTSEGILQSRQWGIVFDAAVFTNLSPEHIESHGSYEKYAKAKELIFKNLHKSSTKEICGRRIKKIIAANCDDEACERFLRHQADEKWVACSSFKCKSNHGNYKYLCAKEIKQTKTGVVLLIKDRYIKIPLHGIFMAKNALLASATALSLGVSLSVCESALEKITSLPGRSEMIESKRGFRVMIDYAHEPKSFAAIFETALQMAQGGRIITVFGVTGGGRDSSKRPKMGEIAAKASDYIVLTTDDPYDDDPSSLISDIVPGIKSARPEWTDGEDWERVVDRRDAIKSALKRARKGDLVLLLGKGSESTMAVAGGKYVPWSDREAVESII